MAEVVKWYLLVGAAFGIWHGITLTDTRIRNWWIGTVVVSLALAPLWPVALTATAVALYNDD